MDINSVFNEPSYFAEVDNYDEETFDPNPALDDNSKSIVFIIGDGSDPAITFMDTFELNGAVKVINTDNTDLATDEAISTASLFPHLLFDSVDVKLQHTPISDTGRHYHLKSYITNNFR